MLRDIVSWYNTVIKHSVWGAGDRNTFWSLTLLDCTVLLPSLRQDLSLRLHVLSLVISECQTVSVAVNSIHSEKAVYFSRGTAGLDEGSRTVDWAALWQLPSLRMWGSSCVLKHHVLKWQCLRQAGSDTFFNREEEVSPKTLPLSADFPSGPSGQGLCVPVPYSKECCRRSPWWSVLSSREKGEMLLRMWPIEAVTDMIFPYMEPQPLPCYFHGSALALLLGVPRLFSALLAWSPRDTRTAVLTAWALSPAVGELQFLEPLVASCLCSLHWIRPSLVWSSSHCLPVFQPQSLVSFSCAEGQLVTTSTSTDQGHSEC